MLAKLPAATVIRYSWVIGAEAGRVHPSAMSTDYVGKVGLGGRGQILRGRRSVACPPGPPTPRTSFFSLMVLTSGCNGTVNESWRVSNRAVGRVLAQGLHPRREEGVPPTKGTLSWQTACRPIDTSCQMTRIQA